MNKVAQTLYIIQRHMEKRAESDPLEGILYEPEDRLAMSEEERRRQDERTAVPYDEYSDPLSIVSYRRDILKKLLRDENAPSRMDPDRRAGLNQAANFWGSTLLGGGLGALYGYRTGAPALAAFMGRDKKYSANHGLQAGATAGAALGIGSTMVGNLAALIAAGCTKKRTLEEQARVDNSKSRALCQLLIPGLAMYDALKATGATTHLRDKSIGEIRREVEEIKRKRNNN